MSYPIETEVIVIKKKTVNVTVEKFVGLRIKKLRLAKNMTQEELSRKLSIGRTSVANLECGRQQLSLRNLEAICKALDCSSSELIPF